jgi:hypothetical protein
VCSFDVFRPTREEPLTEQEFWSMVVGFAIEILTRLLQNILNSALHSATSVRSGMLVKRSELLLEAMTLRRTNTNVCYQVALLTLDPLLYQQYGIGYVFR